MIILNQSDLESRLDALRTEAVTLESQMTAAGRAEELSGRPASVPGDLLANVESLEAYNLGLRAKVPASSPTTPAASKQPVPAETKSGVLQQMTDHATAEQIKTIKGRRECLLVASRADNRAPAKA